MLQKISLIHFENYVRNFAIYIVLKIGRFILFRSALWSMPRVCVGVDFPYECSKDCSVSKNQKTKMFDSKSRSVLKLSKTQTSLLLYMPLHVLWNLILNNNFKQF